MSNGLVAGLGTIAEGQVATDGGPDGKQQRHAGRGAQTGLGWWTTTWRSVASQDQGMAKILLLIGPGAL